jgi:hypothetical protein
MKAFWDERFGRKEYIYGKEPNEYFRQWIDGQNRPGKILLPAEGEGRNAVYAAQNGWEVTAFDQSDTGRTKAITLAEHTGVDLQYDVADGLDANYPEEHFDAVGLVYAHFPMKIRSQVHRNIISWLRPGGSVIMEGFNQDHLEWKKENPSVGGPDNPELLFTEDEIKRDFSSCEVIELKNEVVRLNEGRFHVGKGSVIRFIGKKKH